MKDNHMFRLIYSCNKYFYSIDLKNYVIESVYISVLNMTTVSFKNLRHSLAKYLNKATEDSEEIIVTRSKGRKSVIIDYDDYMSLKETAYLLSWPANRNHLETSLQQFKKRQVTEIIL